MNEIWKTLKDNKTYTDKELKQLIKNNKITGDDLIYTSVLKEPVKVKDTIYSVFIRDNK